MTEEEKKLLDAAKHIIKLASFAARKISVERQRGAGYHHAEVDWLVRERDAIDGWLLKAGAGLGLSSDDAPLDEFRAFMEQRRAEVHARYDSAR